MKGDRPLRVYLWLAFAITWGAGGVALLAGAFGPGPVAPPRHPLYLLAGYGPSMAGIIMAAWTEGWAGVRRLLARAVPTLTALPWYVAVLVGYPAAAAAVTWLLMPDSLGGLPPWGRLVSLVPVTLVLDTGPLGEEFGWRGFALPRMLRRWPPTSAALILGVIWFAWHLPTFFISTLSQSHLSIPVFLVNSLSLSILMTWLQLRTRGDLFVMILVHLMANYCGAIGIPFSAEVTAEVAVAALILAVGGLGPSAAPASTTTGRRTPSGADTSR